MTAVVPVHLGISVLKIIESVDLLVEIFKKKKCGRFLWNTVYIRFICVAVSETGYINSRNTSG